MARLNRCSRCAARRVGEYRFCPNCAFDFAPELGPTLPKSALDDPPVPTTFEPDRGARGVAPGAPRVLDPSVVREPSRQQEVDEIRRDVARVALARHSIDLRARIGGCLGVVVGLVIVGLALPFFAGSNPIALLLLALLVIWVAGYIGSWLVMRWLAR